MVDEGMYYRPGILEGESYITVAQQDISLSCKLLVHTLALEVSELTTVWLVYCILITHKQFHVLTLSHPHTLTLAGCTSCLISDYDFAQKYAMFI